MDLDLDSLLSPGRKPLAEGRIVRELGVEDLQLLTLPAGNDLKMPEKMTSRHHALARAIAGGMSNGEAAASTGYRVEYVRLLSQNPAFIELVGFYRQDVDRVFLKTVERLAGLAHDAVVEITRRVEEAPEEISLPQLVEITKLAADRTGLGPSSKQDINVNVGIRDRIEAARQRARALRAPVEDAEFTVIPPELSE